MRNGNFPIPPKYFTPYPTVPTTEQGIGARSRTLACPALTHLVHFHDDVVVVVVAHHTNGIRLARYSVKVGAQQAKHWHYAVFFTTKSRIIPLKSSADFHEGCLFMD